MTTNDTEWFIWESLKYFERQEFDEADRMDVDLLFMLEELREAVDEPLRIISSYRNDSDSQHGYGKAVDAIFPTCKNHWLDIYLQAERIGFTGLGVYFYWKFYNEGSCVRYPIVGFHFDNRSFFTDDLNTQHNLSGNVFARWIWSDQENEAGEYYPMNVKNLKHFKAL